MSVEDKLAFLFPGQGSQKTGMGKAVAERYPEAREAFEASDRALGFSLSSLCFEGPEVELQLTENTQPAILTVSTALSRVLTCLGSRPDFVAGHSLGEYSALVCAGAIRLEDAVVLVRKRGRYMQEAVPVGVGAMAAILGLAPDEVAALCDEIVQERNGKVVEPANLNGAGQVVIAGHKGEVRLVCELATTRGAKRAIPLAVSAPFHCRLMAPAAKALSKDLDATAFSELAIPLYTNVDARPITTAADARDALERQVASPVRWSETIEALADAGVRRFVEVGPGRVLSGLARKIVRDAETYSVDSPEAIERFVTEARLV